MFYGNRVGLQSTFGIFALIIRLRTSFVENNFKYCFISSFTHERFYNYHLKIVKLQPLTEKKIEF